VAKLLKTLDELSLITGICLGEQKPLSLIGFLPGIISTAPKNVLGAASRWWNLKQVQNTRCGMLKPAFDSST
jgi:hypothetical protein